MFCNGDIITVYAGWAVNGAAWLDIGLGIVLFIVGVISAYALVKFQRKQDEKTEEK